MNNGYTDWSPPAGGAGLITSDRCDRRGVGGLPGREVCCQIILDL